MFTGIIEKVVKVIDLDKNGLLKIQNPYKKEISLGESISVNGCCLSVSDFDDKYIKFHISKESLNITNLKYLNASSFINLERAATLQTRLGGHLISGHIDLTAKVLSIENSENCKLLNIEINSKFLKYFIKKGSLSLNGISLTINDIKKSKLNINFTIIPITLEKTNLLYTKKGDLLNVEIDMMAKFYYSFWKNNEYSKRFTQY